MGNTVSRSHIRDVDPGVAKATRANTKRNSTGFTNELADVNAEGGLLQGDGQYAVDASISGATLPFGANSVPITQHGSKAIAAARIDAEVDPFARKIPDQLFQSGQEETSVPHLRQMNDTHDSTPTVSGAGLPFPENSRGVMYGSSSAETGVAEMTPEALVGDYPNLSSVPENPEMLALSHSPRQFTPISGSGPASGSLIAPRSVPSGLSTRRKRERYQSGNISFSRNTSSQSLPTRVNGTDSSQTRHLFEEELGKTDEPDEKFLAAKPRSDEPFIQRATAGIDPGLIGGSIRDCQNARTSTPPRVDKPPRARKVVSFNENVHVVTYPNDGSSTHSSTAGDIAISRHAEGKLVKKRARGVFRLLSRVAGPAGFGGHSSQSHSQDLDVNGLSDPYDACCGLRLTGVTELTYDDMSSKRKSRLSTAAAFGNRRMPSADSALELQGQSDLVVSFEKVRYTKVPTTSILRPPGIETKAIDNTVEDDFDYCERRVSEDDDTLSLSDAHPSRDAIDEPEAIGDQLLSPTKESGPEERVNSSFNIAPLWQRLKRVDELDIVKSPITEQVSPNGDEVNTCENGVEFGGENIHSNGASSVLRTLGADLLVKDDLEISNSAIDASDTAFPSDVEAESARVGDTRDATQDRVSVHAQQLPGIRSDRPGSARSVESISPDRESKGGTESMATVMYSASSGLDHASQPDRFSDRLSVDPASDADPVLALNFSKSPKISGSSREDQRNGEEFEMDSMPDLQGLTGHWSASGTRGTRRLLISHNSEPTHVQAGAYESKNVPQASIIEDDDMAPFSVGGSARGSLSNNMNSIGSVQDLQLSPAQPSSTMLPDDCDASDESSCMASDGAMDFGPHEGFFDSIIRGSTNGSRIETLESETVRTNRKRNEVSLFSYPGDVGVPYNPKVPVAGVFYGTDSPPSEPETAETRATNGQDLADYPEYAVLNERKENTLHEIEKDVSLMQALRAKTEKLRNVQRGEDSNNNANARRIPFEDRATKRPIPEVLLHDWSGRQPIEPSIEMVDSAPNSRSSITWFPNAGANPPEKRPEFPSAALLLSTRLNADMSKQSEGPQNMEDRMGGETGRQTLNVPSSSNSNQQQAGSSGLGRISMKKVKPAGATDGHRRPKKKGMSLSTNERSVKDEQQTEKGRSMAATRESKSDQGLGTGYEFEEIVKPQPFFTSIPGIHPPDPKLYDFQIAVERKSFSEGGLRGTARVERGTSFAEMEKGIERVQEPRSDFRTYSRDVAEEQTPGRRARRRVVSNAETSVSTVIREENNSLRGVMNRLASGIHLAKRLVSSSYR